MNLRQKNIALILGFIALLWLSYLLSFSKTLSLKKQYKELQKEVALLENGNQKLLTLRQKNNYFDSIFSSKNIAADRSFQNNLLTTINSFAEKTNLNVVSFKAPHTFDANGTAINTYAFTVRANFNDINKLIYKLEQTFKLGKIVSVNFIKKRDYRRRNYYLDCEIFLQRIEK